MGEEKQTWLTLLLYYPDLKIGVYFIKSQKRILAYIIDYMKGSHIGAEILTGLYQPESHVLSYLFSVSEQERKHTRCCVCSLRSNQEKVRAGHLSCWWVKPPQFNSHPRELHIYRSVSCFEGHRVFPLLYLALAKERGLDLNVVPHEEERERCTTSLSMKTVTRDFIF